MSIDTQFVLPSQIPNLSASLSKEEVSALIPSGFDDLFTLHVGDDGVTLRFPNAEISNQDVTISSCFFNPLSSGVFFPKIILQISTFSKKVDYTTERLALNQNEFIWLMLHHRFTQISSNKIPYTHLIREDMKNLFDVSEYTNNCTHNARLKNDNTIFVISPFKNERNGYGFEAPVGESIKSISLDVGDLHSLMRDLSIQPGSETMACKSKFVEYPLDQQFYSCPGYAMTYITESNGSKTLALETIFPIKPNIPARLKSHVISNAFEFDKPSSPIFLEDVLPNKMINKTILNAVVVFKEIDLEKNGRFLCGELETSESFSNENVRKIELIRASFQSVAVNEGEDVVLRADGSALIGIDNEGKEVSLYGFSTVTIEKIVHEDVLTSSMKIVATCTRPIGAARIFSNTGLKGVTKPCKDLGKIHVPTVNGDTAILAVDMISGPNSSKAKGNGIALAKAALAKVLGYDDREEDTISTRDVALINELANKFQKVTYVNEDGVEEKVFAGILPVCANELAYMYNRVKPQSVMPESARVLTQAGYSDLVSEIYKIGISDEDRDAVYELKKILSDSHGVLAAPGEDGLPVYNLGFFAKGSVFSHDDLIHDLYPIAEYEVSRLIDEDYNKGFYIDLRYRNGGVIRFPSAKLINRFTSRLANGTWIYPMFLLGMSKCLEAILTGNIGFLNDASGNASKTRLVDSYLNNINQYLHARRNFLEVLIKPTLKGVGMKQMADGYVPRNTMIVLDNYTYGKLAKKTGGFFQEHGYFRALGIRNPVVWESQIKGYDVWDAKRFDEHCKAEHGFSIYDKLVIELCKDVLLMHPDDIVFQQSDVDGDLMPIFVPDTETSQVMLGELKEPHCLDEELKWHAEYREDEISSNKDFDIEDENGNITYKLNYLRYSKKVGSNPTYVGYFADSIIAKQDVGISTYNMWTLNVLSELFMHGCSDGSITEKNGKPIVYTKHQMKWVSFIYSKLVQNFVIRGIKHTEGGSSGFTPFLLDNMVSSKHRKYVQNFFIRDLNVPADVVRILFKMIFWGKETGCIKNIMGFISYHYKGSVPKKVDFEIWEKIKDQTFMGSLVVDIYDIDSNIRNLVDSGASISVCTKQADVDFQAKIGMVTEEVVKVPQVRIKRELKALPM